MAEDFCYPIERTKLGDYYEMTWRCAKCAYCRNVFPSDTEHERFGRQCPPGERFRFEAYYASGRNELARRTIEGKQGFTDRSRHILYTCTTCNACEQWCKATQGLYPVKLGHQMRKHFVEQGGELLPGHQTTANNLQKSHNRLNRNNRDRLGWRADKPKPLPNEADTAYFVGCRSSFERTEIANNTCELVTEKLGQNLTFLEEERCCGRPLMDLGMEAEAIELIKHNVEQIQQSGVKRVLFSCAECFHTFNSLERFGISIEFEPIHLSQYLAEIARHKPLPLRPMKRRVAFHDPCYLGRHEDVYDQPRALLAAIPDVDLVEMPRNRRNSWCCGSGGGVQEGFPEYSQWIANERLQEPKEVQADLVVTACPGCKNNLSCGAQAQGIEVVDLAELLNACVDAEPTTQP